MTQKKFTIERSVQRRSLVRNTAIAVFVLTIAMLFAYNSVKFSVGNYSWEMMRLYVVSNNERSSEVVKKEIGERQAALELMAELYVEHSDDSLESFVGHLDVCKNKYGFYTLSLLREDGTAIFSDGTTYLYPDYDPVYWEKPSITGVIPSLDGTKLLNSFLCPFTDPNGERMLIVGTYQSSDFANILNVHRLFEGSQSLILDSNGKSVLDLSGYFDHEYQSIVRAIDENPDIVPSAKRVDGNYFTIEHEGATYYAYMTKLGINDWYYMNLRNQSSMYQTITDYKEYNFHVMFFLFMTIIAVVSVLLYSSYCNQKRTFQDAYLDSVTKDFNYEYLLVTLEKKARTKDLAVLAFDIDRFNALNTAYGESVGDEVLRYIIKIFYEEIPNGWVVRQHSDYFVALLDVRSKDEIIDIIVRLQERVRRDINGEQIVPFDLSFGVSHLKQKNHLHDAYKNALIAKRSVKLRSDFKYAFFNDEMKNRQIRAMQMNSVFEIALENGEFQVYYQPKFDMRTREIVGAEALTRWKTKTGEFIMPGEFIPCFEESGKIIFLDDSTIETVCCHIHQLREQGISMPKVSINLSRIQLRQPERIIKKIRTSIKNYQIDPSQLSFEITESALFKEKASLDLLVDALHSLGCKVDMDDFGTGMSGLEGLANTKFDTIKLDRCLIKVLEENRNQIVLRSTIDMIQKLGLSIVVEGVETQAQADFLIAHECYQAQGFLYSKPLSHEEYFELLEMRMPSN